MLSYLFYMQKKRGPKKGSTFQGSHRYEFGTILARERIKKGLTQTELAQKISTTVRVISHFEREVKNPPADTVKKLSEALSIPVERLLYLKDNNNENDHLPLDRGLSKRFEIAQKLPSQARQEVKKFIDAIAKANGFMETTI